MLASVLAVSKELYNAALEECREAWRTQRKSISYADQCRELTELRGQDAEIQAIPVDIAREPLRRVHRAFQGFFRRLKQGRKAGYPRFRSAHRYDSFSASAATFRLEGETLLLSKLGGSRFKAHRHLLGTPRHLVVSRWGAKWVARITSDIGPAPERRAVSKALGIDMRLSRFATLSDGRQVANPHWLKQSEEMLAPRQRALARKRKGSEGQSRACELVRRAYQRIRNLRSNWLHHLPKSQIAEYHLIGFERLNIRGMARSRLAKSILYAAWGELVRQITYKAQGAGVWAVAVTPAAQAKHVPAAGRWWRKDCRNAGTGVSAACR